MDELSNIELIEKYVNYELTEAEEVLFENKRDTDVAFKEELDLAVFLHAQARVKQQAHLKSLAAGIPNSEKETVEEARKKPPVFKMTWFKLAAAVILIPILSIIAYQNLYSTPGRLASQQLDVQKATKISASRSAGVLDNSTNELYTSAIAAYNQKDFELAASLFTNVISNPNATTEQYYQYALSLLYVNKYDAAVQQFEYLLNSGNESAPFHLDSKWYLALAFIKTGYSPKAKELLLEVIEGNHPKKEIASKLMNKIR